MNDIHIVQTDKGNKQNILLLYHPVLVSPQLWPHGPEGIPWRGIVAQSSGLPVTWWGMDHSPGYSLWGYHHCSLSPLSSVKPDHCADS